MARIARAVEGSQRYDAMTRTTFREQERDFSNATALAAVRAAEALGIDLIVCFTETGNTARLLSRYRPSARIVALTPNRSTTGRMTILAHVHPVLFRRESSLEEMLYVASEMLVVRDFARYGDPIVFVAGVPPGITRTTNVMKLHRIGEDVRLH
jgi:pyruvate kinase